MRSGIARNWNAGVACRLLVLLIVGAVLASCAPAERPTSPATQAAQPVAGPPKLLRLDNRQESTWGMSIFAGNADQQREAQFVFQASLTAYNENFEIIPRLATKVPSIADGDWKVSPDGKMDVTWKLRPNLTWHDGAPFTAEDIAFGYQLMAEPDLPTTPSGTTKAVSGTTILDPLTFVVHYSSPYYDANLSNIEDVSPVPVHLMGDLWNKGDKQAFISNSYWFGDFVGLGPYKMVKWESGVFQEGAAFDNYVLGRPKIDRVVIRFSTDPNVSLARLMAGDVDILPRDVAAPARAVLASTSGIKIETWAQSTASAIWQWRNANEPWVGGEQNTQALAIRQAFIHLIDRQAMADNFSPGGPGVADIYALPGQPVYKLVEARGMPKLAYDPTIAARLFASAGWNERPDGLLLNSAGQTLKFELIDGGAEGLVVADYWKRGGIDASSRDIPNNAVDRQRLKTESQGARAGGAGIAGDYMQQFTSKEVRAASNNWSGLNQGGYVNPDVDRRYEQYLVEFDPAKRNESQAAFQKFVGDNVLRQSWYYTVNAGAFTDTLTGPIPATGNKAVITANIQEWDLK